MAADSGVWRQMVSELKREFPTLVITSTKRNRNDNSWHNTGNAVDMAPRMEVFNWIVQNYPNSREVIYTPAGSRQIKNGRSHIYSAGVASGHFDHIHWAVDSLSNASKPGAGGITSAGSSSGGGSNIIAPFIEAFQFFTSPGAWLRIGLAVLGTLLIGMAFLSLTRRKLNLGKVIKSGR